VKIETGKQSLTLELARLQAIVEKKSTMPILQNVLIRTTTGGITLMATDLDAWVMTFVDAHVLEEGEACIPAKKLYEIIKALPEASIDIATDDRQAHIKCQRSKFRLAILPTDNFPSPPSPAAAYHHLQPEVVRNFIERTSFAISIESSRYTLNAAKFIVTSSIAKMVTTDGHRLAYIEKPIVWDGPDIDVLVPQKTLALLVKMTESTEPVEFAQFEGKLYFRIGKRMIVSRMLSGQFPDYTLVFPDQKAVACKVGNDAMLGALRRVQIVADDRSHGIKIEITAGNDIKMTAATAELGESTEMVEAQYNGPDVTIGINALYVTDYFSRMVGSESTEMMITDSASAIECKPVTTDDYAYRYIVMPLRT